MSHTIPETLNATPSTASPGPPRKVFEFGSWATLLWASVVLVGVFAAQAFTADYLDRVQTPADQRPVFFRSSWLDARAAMTALVGLLGLAVARANLALGLRPYLSYSNLSPKPVDAAPKFVVLLRNEGTGPAVISQVKYHLRFKENHTELILEHEKAVNRMEAASGLKEGSDYQLPRFSDGATIGKDKERIALEVNNDAIDRFSALRNFDIQVRYRGMLGDLYEKTIHCLPRPDYQRPHTIGPKVHGTP